MKQIIVLVATIILGLALSSMIIGMKAGAAGVTESANTKIQSVLDMSGATP